MGEFELIRRFFDRAAPPAPGVALGIGDDCALLLPQPGQQLAVSTDMLVEGRHFLSTVDPAALGHKALAVNLSDLAACGATPVAFSLALAMPRVDERFLEGFARGLLALADAHGCELIGGDTTQGPLNICIGVFGQVPAVPAGATALRTGSAALGMASPPLGRIGQRSLRITRGDGHYDPLPGAGTDAKVSGISIDCRRDTGHRTAMARPTTFDSGTKPPPGSPMWARESAEFERWSPITHSMPCGTTTSNVCVLGASPG